jgi:hypothetical protein
VVVRVADDGVLGFEHHRAAARFLAAWRDRLHPCGLELQAEKTHLIACGPPAIAPRKQRGAGKPATFALLGFTPIWERNRKTGRLHGPSSDGAPPHGGQAASLESAAPPTPTGGNAPDRAMAQGRRSGVFQRPGGAGPYTDLGHLPAAGHPPLAAAAAPPQSEAPHALAAIQGADPPLDSPSTSPASVSRCTR